MFHFYTVWDVSEEIVGVQEVNAGKELYGSCSRPLS